MTKCKKNKYIKSITSILNEVKEEQKQMFEKCDRCGEHKEDVKECIDPYNEEINEVIIYTKLCNDCYKESCDEI
jgi:hypothetical protein